MAKISVWWLVAVISIFFVLLYRVKPPVTDPVMVISVDTVYVQTTIFDTVRVKGEKIYVDHVVIDTLTNTVYVYREIESDTYSVFRDSVYSDSLYVKYTSIDDVFLINRNITIFNQHVYTHVLERERIASKPIIVVANFGVWKNDEEYPFSVGLGLRVFGQYNVIANVMTNKQVGLTIGVDF